MNRNLVAKHARTYNKATVEDNRKKKEKRGYSKHKGNYKKDSPFSLHLFLTML